MTWQPLIPTKPNTLQSAADFAALQAGLAACHTLLIHPFQQTVGEGESHYKTLSFPTALARLAEKLQDNTDPFLEQNALLAVAVHANNLNDFASKLDSVINGMGIHAFTVPAQRARHLATLESDKWQIPIASPVQVPISDHIPANSWSKTDEFARARLRQLSHATGQGMIGDTQAELAALQQRKTDHDNAVNSALDDVELPAVDATCCYIASDIVNGIKNSGGPGADQTLTAILAMLGTADALIAWREVCGL